MFKKLKTEGFKIKKSLFVIVKVKKKKKSCN